MTVYTTTADSDLQCQSCSFGHNKNSGSPASLSPGVHLEEHMAPDQRWGICDACGLNTSFRQLPTRDSGTLNSYWSQGLTSVERLMVADSDIRLSLLGKVPLGSTEVMVS